MYAKVGLTNFEQITTSENQRLRKKSRLPSSEKFCTNFVDNNNRQNLAGFVKVESKDVGVRCQRNEPFAQRTIKST